MSENDSIIIKYIFAFVSKYGVVDGLMVNIINSSSNNQFGLPLTKKNTKAISCRLDVMKKINMYLFLFLYIRTGID